jgi:dinuclear metal center YbgI/SA1388 family protein
VPTELTLADVVAVLDELYPPGTAHDWDAVGTVVGDPAAAVRRVHLAVDPTQAVVDEAVSAGADLLVTHHPLLLKPVHSVAATTPKGRVVHALVAGGCALHVCHTNADSPAGGVSESLALAVGLTDLEPLQADVEHLDKFVTFVPHDAVEAVVDAMAAAGAGAIGAYDRCHFVSTGTGSFRPLAGARPAIGSVGDVETVPETRIEMVSPRERRASVLAALRASHPYEEPAFDVLEMAPLPGDSGLGRIGLLAEPMTFEDFAAHVAAALPANHSGLRAAGDPRAVIETVAVCGGAGDVALDTARRAGVDAYVTSDLRHHPASELREHADAPALVDVPHWAAEWTWLPVAAARLRDRLVESGATVGVTVSELVTDPWTLHLPMRSRP